MVTKVWVGLLVLFVIYTVAVYVKGDPGSGGTPDRHVMNGWKVWQDKNCQSCHQLYGLGGYMGPDLTNTAGLKGRKYMRGFIEYGTGKMPAFGLSAAEIDDIISFLSWVDQSGSSRVPADSVHWTGTYLIR